MSDVQVWIQDEIAEGGSAVLTAYLEDETGAAIPLAALGTVRLWLDDQATGTTINGRSDVDIKNANGGTIVETGGRTKLTFPLTPADNVLVAPGVEEEWHIITIAATYNGGAGVVRKEVLFHVVNLSEI